MDCDQGRRLQRNATLGASAGGAAGGESKFTFTFTRQEAKVHCHYLPARSPLFNPDEFFNGWLKQRVKERVAVWAWAIPWTRGSAFMTRSYHRLGGSGRYRVRPKLKSLASERHSRLQ